jgi:hypothetical protein
MISTNKKILANEGTIMNYIVFLNFESFETINKFKNFSRGDNKIEE